MSELFLVDRGVLVEQLEAFADRRLTLEELRSWFTPLLIGETVAVADLDHDLVFRMVFLFEDDSLDEGKHAVNARRLVGAMRSPIANDVLLELLPVIAAQDRIAEILARYHRGLISRTSFLSAIRETRFTQRIKEWLSSSKPVTLERFRVLLDDGHYLRLAELLRIPEAGSR